MHESTTSSNGMSAADPQIRIAAVALTLLAVCLPAPAAGGMWEDLGLYGGQVLSVTAAADGTLFAGTWSGDGLFRSDDTGRTWVQIPQEDPSWFRNLEIFDIACAPGDPATLWVANGIYLDLSHDSGHTWQTFYSAADQNRFCLSLSADPHDATGTTVCVGTGGPGGSTWGGCIFRTADSGQTWARIGTAAREVLDLTHDPGQPERLWAVSAPWAEDPQARCDVLQTDSGGVFWKRYRKVLLPGGASAPFGPLNEVLVPCPDEAPLACGSGGIAVLDWSTGRSGGEAQWGWSLYGQRCSALAAAADTATTYGAVAGNLVASSDCGRTWQTHSSEAGQLLCLTTVPGDSQLLLGGSQGSGVYRSEDSGLQFEQANEGIRANTVFDTLWPDSGADTLLCGTLGGLYTGTATTGWHLLQDRTTYCLAGGDQPDAGLWAGQDNGLSRSADGGATWEFHPVPREAGDHYVAGIAPAPGDPECVYAALAFLSGDQGAVLRVCASPDTAPETLLRTPAPANALAVHPTDSTVLLAGTGWFYAPGLPGGLYRSTDSGRTWDGPCLPDLVVNSIAFDPRQPNTVFAACGDSAMAHAGIYKSSDGGCTWKPASIGLPPICSASDIRVDPRDSGVVYAALYRALTDTLDPLAGVYVSCNSGGYWTQIGLSDYSLFYLCPSAATGAVAGSGPLETNLLAGTSSGLLRSSIAGSGFVTGTVTDAISGEPLDDVVVSAACGATALTSGGWYQLLVPAGSHTLTAAAPGFEHGAQQTVTVPAGTSQEADITLRAAPRDTACFLSGLAPAGQLKLLRRFRDGVMTRTGIGRHLTDLYYRCSPSLHELLRSRPGLRAACAELVETALPLIDAVAAGRDTPPPAGLRDAGAALLRAVAQAAPPDLRPAVQELRRLVRAGCIDALLGRCVGTSVHHPHQKRPRPAPRAN